MSGAKLSDGELVSGEYLTADASSVSEPRRAGWIPLAVAAGFVLLAMTCGLAGLLAWQAVRATDAMRDSLERRRAATLMVSALLNAETGQRGYLLTRDPLYLEPYAEAGKSFASALTVANGGIGESTRDTGLVDEMRRTGDAKLAELARTVDLMKTGKLAEAMAIVTSGYGKSLMDSFRVTADTFVAAREDDIARWTATQRDLSVMLSAAILTALVCVAGLGWLLLWDSRRHVGVLRARDQSLRQVTSGLEQRLARRNLELSVVNQRFDAALRTSGVTVMTQDRDLVFTWISQGAWGLPAGGIVGKSEREVTPEPYAAAVIAMKREVLDTGRPTRGDVRIMHDSQEYWFELFIDPMRGPHGAIDGVISGAVQITRHKQQQAHIRLLMREITHRSKNLMAVIEAIMRQTMGNSLSLTDFEERFSARIHSLAGAHDLLVNDDWVGASLRELVRSQLGHYSDLVGSQITLEGEEMWVNPDPAQHLGMALHELATNAAKYGALSTPSGSVRIAWTGFTGADGSGQCRLSWEEAGGPPVTPPARRGFGRVVIERTVARAMQGRVKLDFAPEGLRWAIEFPDWNLVTR